MVERDGDIKLAPPSRACGMVPLASRAKAPSIHALSCERTAACAPTPIVSATPLHQYSRSSIEHAIGTRARPTGRVVPGRSLVHEKVIDA